MIKILDFAEVTAEEVFSRNEPTADVSDIVAAIIKDVRENGDEAVIRYAAKFDGVDPEFFCILLTRYQSLAFALYVVADHVSAASGHCVGSEKNARV